jgi:hypothetical protein
MGVFSRGPDSLPSPLSRARPAQYGARRAITASAERINLARAKPLDAQGQRQWQVEAWQAYDRVGEIHQAFNLSAALLSRIRIYAGVVGATNEAPINLGEAKPSEVDVDPRLIEDTAEILSDLTSSGFPAMVNKFSLNWSIPGECYLVEMPPDPSDEISEAEKTWTLCSSSELQIRAGSMIYTPRQDGSIGQRTLPKSTFVARIWRQHPQYTREADSSMRALGDPVEELLLLSRLVRGAMRSRMNAGLLYMPDGISAPGTMTADPPIEQELTVEELANQATEDPGNAIAAALMDAMTKPISDEASAANVVPMLVTGPTDLGSTIRYISFERPSDAWLVDRDVKMLDRIMNGIEVPKEAITGMQAVKYSNAVVIDDNLYKATIEPVALNLVDALTDAYLRPRLLAKGWKREDLKKIVVWYDPSEIVTRPNAADDATEGFDRFILSAQAWRREHGFAESDAPDEQELLRMLIVAMKGMPETVVMKALEQIFGKQIDFEEIQEQKDKFAQNLQGDDEQDGDDAEVKQFPKAVPDKAQPPADPQATAIKQVGVK